MMLKGFGYAEAQDADANVSSPLHMPTFCARANCALRTKLFLANLVNSPADTVQFLRVHEPSTTVHQLQVVQLAETIARCFNDVQTKETVDALGRSISVAFIHTLTPAPAPQTLVDPRDFPGDMRAAHRKSTRLDPTAVMNSNVEEELKQHRDAMARMVRNTYMDDRSLGHSFKVRHSLHERALLQSL